MKPDLIEFRTVVLAALLHDIGKFLQRGSFGSLDTKGKHPQVSGVFISAYESLFAEVADVSLLKTLVERHHEHPSFRPDLSVQDLPQGQTRALAYLISQADNLSSSERGEAQDQYQDFKTTPLAPVFGRVTLEGQEKATPLRYHPRPLGNPPSLKVVFPEDFAEYRAGEMNQLLTAFGEEFRELSSGIDKADFDCLLTHLMGILYKYTWCVPANTQEEIPDVSLYDHLKTTSAIAACLYSYHAAGNTLNEQQIKSDTQKFRLVVGDISGIQNYIFDIATARAGGVARRLRSRSLFVQLLTEVVSHRILRALDLPFTNIIMASGGKFYLLVPNIPEAEETVTRVQQECDEWLLEELNGEIAIHLAMVPFGNEGFEANIGLDAGFGRILNDIDLELQRRKRQSFGGALTGSAGWQADAFLRPTSFDGEPPCVSCGKFPGKGEGGLCTRCDNDRDWGKEIPSTKYIAFFDDEKSGGLPLLGCSVSLARTVRFSSRPYLILKLNDTDLMDLAHFPALPRYLSNHIPRASQFDCESCPQNAACTRKGDRPESPDEPAKFQCLAYHSEGRPMLGFLKVDVDNLGKLFVYGLKRDGPRQYDTISRLTTFSRMLDTFFSGWIEHLANLDFPRIYTVFSGGDDLFLVGPWDDILSLSERIKDDFARYTGSPQMTLSAGVFVSKARFPMSRAAAEVNDDLEASKQGGRDALTILGNTLSWEEWRFAREQWEHLQAAGEQVSSAFLYNLLRYADMWRDYSRHGDVLGLRFQPLLAYSLARTGDRNRFPTLYDWAAKLLRIPVDGESTRILDSLGLIATLLIYSRRGGTES